MRLSHITLGMPKGAEDRARAFYAGLLGLREIPKPEMMRSRGGCWFDADGLDVHLSVEDEPQGKDNQRHFGLECADLEAIKAKLMKAGIEIDPGKPAPWKRFYIHDPFGNRIEIHEVGGLRA